MKKENSIEFGAVHLDNNFEVIGFCKRPDSDEICEVDVYIDGDFIETITANETILKVELVYDIIGHGFEYHLEDKYFDKPHFIEFKARHNGVHLFNSGIYSNDKNHPEFNEYRFLKSLEHPIDEERIKNLYMKDSVGFLAIEENLNDKDFVAYIKELYVRFPHVTFKAFYFSDEHKKLAKKIFNNEIDRHIFLCAKNIYDIANQINIYLFNGSYPKVMRKLYETIVYNCKNIFSINYINNYNKITIAENDNKLLNSPYMRDPEYFNIKVQNNSFSQSFYNPILENVNETPIDINMNLGEFIHFKQVDLALKIDRFAHSKYKLNLLYKEYLEAH